MIWWFMNIVKPGSGGAGTRSPRNRRKGRGTPRGTPRGSPHRRSRDTRYTPRGTPRRTPRGTPRGTPRRSFEAQGRRSRDRRSGGSGYRSPVPPVQYKSTAPTPQQHSGYRHNSPAPLHNANCNAACASVCEVHNARAGQFLRNSGSSGQRSPPPPVTRPTAVPLHMRRTKSAGNLTRKQQAQYWAQQRMPALSRESDALHLSSNSLEPKLPAHQQHQYQQQFQQQQQYQQQQQQHYRMAVPFQIRGMPQQRNRRLQIPAPFRRQQPVQNVFSSQVYSYYDTSSNDTSGIGPASTSASSKKSSIFSAFSLDSRSSVSRRRKVGLGLKHPGSSIVTDNVHAKTAVVDGERMQPGQLKKVLAYYRSAGVNVVGLAPHEKRLNGLSAVPGVVFTPPATVFKHYLLDFAMRKYADIISNNSFRDVVQLQKGNVAQSNMRAFLDVHLIPFTFVHGNFFPNPNPVSIGRGVHSPRRKLKRAAPVLRKSRSMRTI